MRISWLTLLVGLGSGGVFAELPEYRAWIHEVDCADLSGRAAAQAEWSMGLKFLGTDVYVELQKAGFKHVKKLLRAESLAKVDELRKHVAWQKANRARFSNEAELLSASRRAVREESLGRYVQKTGLLDWKKVCACYNREKRKLAPGAEDFQRKREELSASEAQRKAACVSANFKSGSWLPW